MKRKALFVNFSTILAKLPEVNTPPAEASGRGLRLKAGSAGLGVGRVEHSDTRHLYPAAAPFTMVGIASGSTHPNEMDSTLL